MNQYLLLFLFCIFGHGLGLCQQVPLQTPPYFEGCSHLPQGSVLKESCSNKAVVAFVKDHLEVPQELIDAGISGRVIVKFNVDNAGNIQDVATLRDLGYGTRAAAIAVVEAFPKWEAATVNAKPVSMTLHLPVFFGAPADGNSDGYRLSWGDLVDTEINRPMSKILAGESLLVRDRLGNFIKPIELLVGIVKKDKLVKQKSSNGDITDDQAKLIRKISSSCDLLVIATIQEDGAFKYVEQVYTYVK